ncbi:Cof-type HAD-IIB family hydrolase [Mycoplasma sp. U97]|uniref:HAD family hydrolase n=1 Tax=Mycoplasma tauri TaxID=547987 RepID=UPI001CBDCE24|nr:HAD family hydrolase [Mycoplasma tauri]MBZ4212724.1 Cof-type HAD-IIB family hydrolase [Mycoplasma tauri]
MNLTEKKLIKRIIFSDVDGTIYTYPDKQISKFTKQDILNAINNEDIEFVLNTGNPLLPKLNKLADEIGVRYIICANGASIYDNFNHEVIYEASFNSLDVKKTYDLIAEFNENGCFFGKNGYHLLSDNQQTINFLSDFFEFSNWEDKSNKPHEEIHKIEIYPKNSETKNLIVHRLNDMEIEADIAVMTHHIELTPKNINKGTAALWLCNKLNIDSNYAMSIGDSGNDIPMLELIGYSYAMDNAPQYVKNVAKFYTSDVLQNGLGEAIRDYIHRTRLPLLQQEKQFEVIKKQQKAKRDAYYREKAKQK